MGMSTYVMGVIDLNRRFHKMIALKEACDAAEIDYPIELEEYFRDTGIEADEETLRRDKEEIDLGRMGVAVEYGDEYRSGVEVLLSDIPAEVKAIRFVNTW
jgi:hypothetical protein